jgi:hypothetical protein
MDVTKLPPPGIADVRAPATSPGEPGLQTPANLAAMGDRADIRPLDIQAALQILLAEVRAAFEQQAILAVDRPALDQPEFDQQEPAPAPAGRAGAVPDTPPQAARVLVEMAVQSLPDEPGVAAWTAALSRMESALQAGIEQAIDAVSAWRDVPSAVIDATKETRTLVLAILGDDPQNPLWLRPEWAGFAPRLERFWRRRRIARRRLADPDHGTGSFDDGYEHRP